LRGAALSVVAGVLLAGACARDASLAWDAAAARAVARTAAAEAPGESFAVLQNQGGSRGRELPWGVRQSLTTGGITVAEDVAAASRVMILDDARRDGEDWIVHTRIHRRSAAQDTVAWRVRCPNDACEAARIP